MTRPEPPPIPLQADEATTLLAFLDYYRAALVDRAYGLTVEQLRQTLPPSTLSLGRLLGHMAYVELTWFAERFDGEELAPPWTGFDWDADADAEMTMAEGWSPEALRARFDEAVDDSRARTAAALSADGGGLDATSTLPSRDGEHWNLRWILVHMIEEYARHCGHADFIRESIDGDLAH
ncbi:MAG: DinB family protein [Acidimicrobiales bacterium]